MEAARTLWRDETGGRFYLVPSDVTPARGTLLLRAGATRTHSVRAAAVARYEVTRDEARAFLDARLGAFAAEGKRKVEDALAGLGIPVPHPRWMRTRNPVPACVSSPRSRPRRWGRSGRIARRSRAG